jgi:hypothetical protein
MLLLPIMLLAWFSSALLIWGLVPGLTFVRFVQLAGKKSDLFPLN